ncbi:MAG: methyltransferase domain-containing protein [Methylococcaceae bacterium]|nr:MAG: methyltransferase domain-containing protein [Methylococcaceae bacterium]
MLVEQSVRERYSEGARQRQEALCCPVDYDRRLLALLPQEIIDKDYGCGDPSRYVQPGDTVLDLGSGGGKVCYLAAQLVGPEGRVIGVDMNDDMLALARRYQAEMAEKLGGDRVRFVKGYIQDLALDVEAMESHLATQAVTDAASLARLQAWQARQRHERPLIPDQSVDLVISNCVLNLVDDGDKQQLVREIFRVLKPGGRAAISDIVADEAVPEHLKQDPELWSGCLSGAFQEQAFSRAFATAGFAGVCLDKWSEQPWRVIEGIEFRAATLLAVKGHGRECLDRGHAVIYRGPYAEIRDDEGHVFLRGERIAVCERTFRFLSTGPFKQDFIGIEPRVLADPTPWCAPPGTRRPASAGKGGRQIADCGDGACC